MKIKNYILLIVTLCFFLTPALTFGCEKGCSKEKKVKSEMNDCCEKDNHPENHDGCGRKCGHSSCNCSIAPLCAVNLFTNELMEKVFNFSIKNTNFNHAETNISSGFFSLWLIPKIS